MKLTTKNPSLISLCKIWNKNLMLKKYDFKNQMKSFIGHENIIYNFLHDDSVLYESQVKTQKYKKKRYGVCY